MKKSPPSHHPGLLPFRLRAFYPNYFTIRQLLAEQDASQTPFDHSVFPAPELEYYPGDEPGNNLLRLKNLDVLILSQSDRQKADNYLHLLIESSSSISMPSTSSKSK